MLKRFGLKVVAFTGHADSDLAQGADHRLLYRVRREACPLELAPTASTTVALALGDALAMVLLESRQLTRDDFAKYHPAGNLGRVLLLRVRDIMRTGSFTRLFTYVRAALWLRRDLGELLKNCGIAPGRAGSPPRLTRANCPASARSSWDSTRELRPRKRPPAQKSAIAPDPSVTLPAFPCKQLQHRVYLLWDATESKYTSTPSTETPRMS